MFALGPLGLSLLGSRVELESQSTTDAPPGEKHKHKYKHKWFAVLLCTCLVLNLTFCSPYPCNDSINKQQKSPPRKLSR